MTDTLTPLEALEQIERIFVNYNFGSGWKDMLQIIRSAISGEAERFPKRFSPNHGWAHAMQADEPAFILRYEDQDKQDLVFTGYGAEKAALTMWEKANTSWNCALFKTMRTVPFLSPPDRSARIAEKTCASCDGTGWVNDQNWEPRFPDVWPPDEREPGNGKIQCGICLGTGTVEPDQSARIEELEKEVQRLRLELSLKRPTDMDVAQTHQARRDYRAKLKELYGNPDTLPMEITRLKNALGQIARMKCFPDAATNMTTLTAARRIAEQALHTETREAPGAAEMVCPTAHANGGHCPLHNLHCAYPACRTMVKPTGPEGAI